MKKTFIPMKEAVFSTMEMLESIHGKQGASPAFDRIPALDSMTGGFRIRI